MSLVVQQYPLGLLSLLGAKSFGVPPSKMDDSVQATVDVTAFLQSPLLFSSGGSSLAITTADTGAINTVPDGEAWLMIACHASLTNASAAIADLAVKLTLQPAAIGAGPSCTLAFLRGALASADQELTVAALFPQPTLLGPGTVFSGRLASTPGGAKTVDAYVRSVYYRIAI